MARSPMREKLAEAQYFRTKMDQNASATFFKYELSAFLTAARTVLQYFRAECCKARDQERYDKKMADRTLRFSSA